MSQSIAHAAEGAKLSPGQYAVIETTLGKIVCRLFPDKAPKTVESFVGLTEGTREFTDARTGQKVKRPFFNGIIFHRVIPGFMIQGGDPLGTGYGGPGYKFENETLPELVFDKPGKLAMANAGPDTNGSQFFITTDPTPQLNGDYTIFGEVVDGQSVVDTISKVPRDPSDKPLTPVVMNKVTILRVGEKSKK